MSRVRTLSERKEERRVHSFEEVGQMLRISWLRQKKSETKNLTGMLPCRGALPLHIEEGGKSSCSSSGVRKGRGKARPFLLDRIEIERPSFMLTGTFRTAREWRLKIVRGKKRGRVWRLSRTFSWKGRGRTRVPTGRAGGTVSLIWKG